MDRKPVAAVLLADEQRTFRLAKLLEEEQLRPLVLHSTDDFHQVLNRDCVDLAILDNRLRGFLSGIEVLERMYRDLVKPVTILLTDPSADVERRCRRLGVDRVFPWNAPLEDVVSTAQNLVSAYLRDRVLVPPKARTLVQQAGFISPLPQVLVQMSAYLGHDDDHAAEKLARDISVDARLTAELLKLTNSSAMGRPYKTTNVFDAVRFLGVRRTVAMVLSAGVFRIQSPMLHSLSPQLRSWYQYRSVLIGSTASAFANALEDASAPTAYLLGLLQDIGSLVLGHAYGSRYDQLLERVRLIQHLRRDQLEMQEFQTDHAQVSAALLQKWELPPSLVSIVLRHHERDYGVERPTVEQSFLRVMRIGEHVADIHDARSSRRFLDLNETLSHYGKAKSGECKSALITAIDQASESSKLFSIPVPDEKTIAALVEDLASRCVIDDQPGGGGDAKDEAIPPSDHAERCQNVVTPASGSNRRFTLLVIEDDMVTITLIRRFVDGYPIDVIECGNLETARELASRADVIACDVHLGPMEGPEIIRELRANGFNGGVLMMSVDTSRQTVLECIELQINGFLAKPFSRSRLIEKLEEVLPIKPTVESANMHADLLLA